MSDFRFFIVDDHAMLSSGVSAFLASQFPNAVCIASFKNAEECIAGVSSWAEYTGGGTNKATMSPRLPQQPFLAFVDLNLAGTYSFPLIKALAARKIKVLVYTMFESSAFALRAVECGASAYILKGGNEADLIAAVRTVLDGRTFIAPSLQKNVVDVMQVMSAFSKKEKLVATHVMEGLDNAQIAASMQISKRSVENYLSHMYDKVGVTSRAALKARLG